jgi:hypothetical protein
MCRKTFPRLHLAARPVTVGNVSHDCETLWLGKSTEDLKSWKRLKLRMGSGSSLQAQSLNVIPAKAGIALGARDLSAIPTFVGMTV